MRDPREELAERIAGEVALSSDPGGTIRKWREEFGIAQTTLADELDVSASVVSDYESGRRDNPGIGIVRRLVEGLLDIDERHGGTRIRQHARVLSAGFDQDVVLDLREYSATAPVRDFYRAIGADEIVKGRSETIAGHTIIDSVEAIKRLSRDDFYRLYGQSTNRALVFTGIERGESPLVAMRVVIPTPSAVVLHGIDREQLWEHAPALARADGISLATSTTLMDEMLEALRNFP